MKDHLKSYLDRKFNYTILVLLLLFLNVNAQALTEGQSIWQRYVPNWFPLFAVAAGIGLGITGIAFMFSRVFQLPQLETWARTELFEVVGSIFLVLIIFITLGVIDNLFIATVNKKPLDISLEFTERISDRLIDRYIDSIKIGAAIGLLSGPPVQYLGATSSDFDKPGQNKGAAEGGEPKNSDVVSNRIWMVAIQSFRMHYLTFYAADLFNGHFNLIQSITLSSVVLSILSHVLLKFIDSIAIPFLIPFGLFLSMFSFTRKTGRTIIAFGVGLYLFVPLSIIITQIMYDSAFKPNTQITDIKRPSGNVDIDRFTREVFAYEALDFFSSLLLAKISIITEGEKPIIPSCVTGAGSLASAVCLMTAPVCIPIFSMICGLLATIGDTASLTDNFTYLQNSLSVLKAITLSQIMDVPITTQIESTAAVIVGLSVVAISSALVFHIIPINVLTSNYISLLMQQIAGFGQYELSAITASWYANMNQYLAIKLTNITLAYIPYVMQDAVPILLLPIIVIFTVVTGIRSISPAIGGEIQILGLSELV